jgi:hypothetical protein
MLDQVDVDQKWMNLMKIAMGYISYCSNVLLDSFNNYPSHRNSFGCECLKITSTMSAQQRGLTNAPIAYIMRLYIPKGI